MALLLHKKFFSHLRKFVLSGNKLTELEPGSRIWATPVLPMQRCSVWLTRRLLPITCYHMSTPRHVSVLGHVTCVVLWRASLLPFFLCRESEDLSQEFSITRKLVLLETIEEDSYELYSGCFKSVLHLIWPVKLFKKKHILSAFGISEPPAGFLHLLKNVT